MTIVDRELLGSPRPPEPSPGPWSVREGWSPRMSGETHRVYVVLDANSKYVADCDSRANADLIVRNGPPGPPICAVFPGNTCAGPVLDRGRRALFMHRLRGAATASGNVTMCDACEAAYLRHAAAVNARAASAVGPTLIGWQSRCGISFGPFPDKAIAEWTKKEHERGCGACRPAGASTPELSPDEVAVVREAVLRSAWAYHNGRAPFPADMAAHHPGDSRGRHIRVHEVDRYVRAGLAALEAHRAARKAQR